MLRSRLMNGIGNKKNNGKPFIRLHVIITANRKQSRRNKNNTNMNKLIYVLKVCESNLSYYTKVKEKKNYWKLYFRAAVCVFFPLCFYVFRLRCVCYVHWTCSILGVALNHRRWNNVAKINKYINNRKNKRNGKCINVKPYVLNVDRRKKTNSWFK